MIFGGRLTGRIVAAASSVGFMLCLVAMWSLTDSVWLAMRCGSTGGALDGTGNWSLPTSRWSGTRCHRSGLGKPAIASLHFSGGGKSTSGEGQTIYHCPATNPAAHNVWLGV